MAKAVVTDRPQSAGQHVAKVAFYELPAGNRLHPHRVIVGAVLPTEADVSIRDGNDARIANRRAADIAAEIFDDASPASAIC